MPVQPTRRSILSTLAFAGSAALLPEMGAQAAEPPPEVTTVRIPRFPGTCVAPEYVGEKLLLHAEGFTDVRYVDPGPEVELSSKVGRNEADMTMEFAARAIQTIDAGGAVTVIGGVHVGCYEVFARTDIHSIGELKGKSVGVRGLGNDQRTFLIAMATHIGLDPNHDIEWVTNASGADPLELFAEGKIDAFLGTPPEPQELRARQIGHVIFNSIIDRRWSNYFCCVLAANRSFVRHHPIATKRMYRAVLKAADLCATEPERSARRLVDGGFTENYDYALQSLREVQYGKWRDYDPLDTIRLYALRLHEGGLIKSTPQKIISEGTDWRFLNELKRELKT